MAEQESCKEQEQKQKAPKTTAEIIKGFFSDLADMLQAGIVTMFIFMLGVTYFFQPVTVDGTSMVPTLRDEDRLWMAKLLFPPTYGRIVVIDDKEAGLFADDEQTQIRHTQGMGIVLIKRVIATSGQEINIDINTGTVTVDGKVLDEPYIAAPTQRDDGAFRYPITVPEGYIFVMGDNRMHSSDSRCTTVGLVPKDQVLGVAVLRVDRNPDLVTKWTDRFDWLL